MRKLQCFLLVCAVLAVSATAAEAQSTVGTGTGGPNNWEKEYADGKAAYVAGNYREAEKQLKAALKSTREFASNDPKVATTLNDLSQVYRAQSKYADAEPLMERHLALKERFLGKFHPDLAKDI